MSESDVDPTPTAQSSGPDLPVLDQVRTIVHELETPGGKYSPPNADEILATGDLHEEAQSELLARAESQGHSDAAAGVLRTHGDKSNNLDELGRTIRGRMDDVAGAREKIVNELEQAIAELDAAASDLGAAIAGADHKRELKRVNFEVEVTRARRDNLKSVASLSTTAMVTAIVAAVIGLAVDGFFLGDALEEQNIAGLGTTASVFAGFLVAAFLSALAWLSGVQMAKGIVDRDISQTDLKERHSDFQNAYTERVGAEGSEAKWHRYGGLAIAAIVLLGFGTLALQRLQLAIEDGQLFVIAAIILFALLGLVVFFVEGFMLERMRAKEKAEEAYQNAVEEQNRLQELSQLKDRLVKASHRLSRYAGLPISDATQGGEGPGGSPAVVHTSSPCPLDLDIADALWPVQEFIDQVVDRYKAAAVTFLESPQVDSTLTEQLDDFQRLNIATPKDPYTPRVDWYLNLAKNRTSSQVQNTGADA